MFELQLQVDLGERGSNIEPDEKSEGSVGAFSAAVAGELT